MERAVGKKNRHLANEERRTILRENRLLIVMTSEW